MIYELLFFCICELLRDIIAIFSLKARRYKHVSRLSFTFDYTKPRQPLLICKFVEDRNLHIPHISTMYGAMDAIFDPDDLSIKPDDRTWRDDILRKEARYREYISL